MLSSTRTNRSQSSSSYGTLHYTYYNPTSSYNKQFNISKRQRAKDSYVEIAKEKKNFISYEIMQIQKYTEKKKSKTINSKSQSCPKFNTTKLKNKLINNEKENNTSIKNTKINANTKINEVNYEIQNVEIVPYSTTLRNYSSIINNDSMKNIVKNKDKIINKRNRNYIGSYKINNRIKEMFKSDLKKNYINNIINDLSNNKKEEKSESVCLGKISIETYSYNEKKNSNNIYVDNKLNNSPLIEEQNNNNNNINNNMILLNKKENIINNNNYNYIDFSFNAKPIKRKLNYEEEKNNNEIQIPTENKSENKIFQTIEKMKAFLEKTKSTFIQSYAEKNLKQKYIQNTINKNNIKNKNKTSIKNKLIKHSSSCPKVIHSNKSPSSSTSEIIQTNSFKENINKILKRNKELYTKNKKYFEEKEEKKSNCNYKVIKENKYVENKLKELLKKIPKHNNNQRNKSVIEFKSYKEKTFNLNETKRTNRIKNNRNNLSNIMPPNNLKEIVLKKEMNFWFN